MCCREEADTLHLYAGKRLGRRSVKEKKSGGETERAREIARGVKTRRVQSAGLICFRQSSASVLALLCEPALGTHEKSCLLRVSRVRRVHTGAASTPSLVTDWTRQHM